MYILLELKITGDEFEHNIESYLEETAARIAYYQLLAVAISSEVETHSVLLLASDGTIIEKQTFAHQVGEPNVVEINNNVVI